MGLIIRTSLQGQAISWSINIKTIEASNLVQVAGNPLYGLESSSKLLLNKIQGSANKMTKIQHFTIIR